LTIDNDFRRRAKTQRRLFQKLASFFVWQKKTKEYFVNSNIGRTFVSPVPAEPLHNAQIGGSFFYTTMKINYSKTCTLPQNLILLLKSRGLIIPDEQRAVSHLINIGYFRLSAYLFPLLNDPKTEHSYKEGATFDMALDMYRFDRKLRILLFNEIEKIEVAIRSAMNNWVSDGLGNAFWMTDAAYFKSSAIFVKTTALILAEIEKSKEEFIVHFQNKYSNLYLPAWMISEIIPLGVLYNIFNNLKNKSLKKK
jgi:abortive infection bacteriophage resistance protein